MTTRLVGWSVCLSVGGLARSTAQAEIPREQFPRSIVDRDVLATMSLTCHEEIGRVGRVGRGCYEDASDLSATSRACRARGIRRTTRHTDKRAALYPAADRRPTNQVSARLAERESRPTRATSCPGSIFARMSRVSDVSTRMSRGCCENATTKLPPWNLGFSDSRIKRHHLSPSDCSTKWNVAQAGSAVDRTTGQRVSADVDRRPAGWPWLVCRAGWSVRGGLAGQR